MTAELRQRLFVAVLGVPLGIYSAYVGGWFFTLMVSLISLLITRELMRLLRHMSLGAVPWITYVASLAIPILAHLFGVQPLAIIVWAAFIVTGISSLRSDPNRGAQRLVATVFVYTFVGFPVSSLILLRDSATWQSNFAGGVMIMYIIGGVWIVDTFAYIFGKKFGRHTLWKALSPKKTIEGVVGSLLSGVVFSLLWAMMIADHIPVLHRVFIGLLIGSISVIGDLVQSMLKRAVGVKDSGTFFPGHGGVFDRFDSLLFVAPTIYLYVLAAGLVLPR